MTRDNDDTSEDPVRSGLDRRSWLRVTGGAIAGIAGCTGRDRPGSPTSTAGTPGTERSPTATRTSTATPTPPDEGHAETYVYASRPQLEAVAARATAGEEPWASGYRKMLARAKGALTQEPLSVVDDGAPLWDDPHRFGQDDERHDYHAAIDMTTAVRDAALGYWFTGRDRYAEGAIDLLHHWCLDPETRMAPNADMAMNGVAIEVWITVPKLWYAASLLRGHRYWREKTGEDLEAAFQEWVRTLIESIPDPGYPQHNNIWAWRIQTIAGAGVYLGDEDLFEQALTMWRAERNWLDYRKKGDGRGGLKLELQREDALSYHVYGTKALAMTAEIAYHQGVDLYGYNAPTDPEPGPTLAKLFRFMAPYLAEPSTWKWGTGEGGIRGVEHGNFASLYELGYSRYREPEFRDVVGLVGRPVYDFWMLGWATLTHANLFELDIAENER